MDNFVGVVVAGGGDVAGGAVSVVVVRNGSRVS